jgi:hypothetical protein
MLNQTISKINVEFYHNLARPSQLIFPATAVAPTAIAFLIDGQLFHLYFLGMVKAMLLGFGPSCFKILVN